MIRPIVLLIATALVVPGLSAGPAPADPPRRVAVTIDDLPVASSAPFDLERWQRITVDLLEAIAKHEVPAVGFVNERKLYVGDRPDPARVALLESWLAAGLELGNHTYSHPDLHKVELDRFEDEIVLGEKVTRALLAERDAEPRYFRHPYLHTGRDLETKHAVEAFLADHGYRVAPVTIDNSEWIYAKAYDRAAQRGDSEAMARIAESYVEYMEAKFAYFERQTEELFGHAIPQVLLIHANRLNADHFDDLAGMMAGRGYRFVTLDEALADEAYGSEDAYTGAGGITWLHRWALTQGKKGDFFEGEPRTPAFVLDEAGLESE